jgi:hypothetical protein
VYDGTLMSTFFTYQLIYSAVGLFVAGFLALIPANIAKSKGRSFGLWWFYGWMLFIVALVHSLLLQPDEAAQLAVGGRKCPYCAEVVKRDAVVCRYCGRDLEPAKPDDEDEVDYAALEAAELAVLPQRLRERQAQADPGEPAGPGPDYYKLWLASRSEEDWSAFLESLYSARSLPHGGGAADVLAGLYPEASGRPEFDGLCRSLEAF